MIVILKEIGIWVLEISVKLFLYCDDVEYKFDTLRIP